MLQITSTGEQAVEKATNLLTPRGAVLSLLYEVKQGAEVEDIMAHTKMDEVKCTTVVRSLLNDKLIQEV
jgi:PIN domain nuclease of toxin-antitoxin system